MDGHGRLTIELGNASLDDDYALTHDEVVPGQYVLLAVSDNGSGMAPEVVERVFEPFFSTKGEGKGSGLGLSMVYGFVKQSGGHVKIYSEVGEGTTIKLYLPRAMASEDVEVSVDHGPVTGGSETVLVVEDDAEGARDRRRDAERSRLSGAEGRRRGERPRGGRERGADRHPVHRRRHARHAEEPGDGAARA